LLIPVFGFLDLFNPIMDLFMVPAGIFYFIRIAFLGGLILALDILGVYIIKNVNISRPIRICLIGLVIIGMTILLTYLIIAIAWLRMS